MLATPLQLANATASMGMQGKRFRPHLLELTVNEHGNEHKYKPLEEYPVQLKDKANWSIISEAMQDVVKSRSGTGHRFGRDSVYTIAAKTGTSQVFSGDKYAQKQYNEIPEALRDHSLFIAFAPVNKPEVAIAVLVENDFVASTIARQVLDIYFNLNKKNKST
jgi:penicillin-binding protein 2